MFKKLDDAMGRLQDRLDAMPIRTLFKYLAIGMAVLVVLGLVTPMIH